MASPCNGSGLQAGKLCPQCRGTPSQDVECSEARRRGAGIDIPRAWESASFFTAAGARVVKHPLGRIPAFVDVLWERAPRFKAKMAGEPEYAADFTFKIVRRALDEVEYTIEVATGAEPGTYRLRVMG